MRPLLLLLLLTMAAPAAHADAARDASYGINGGYVQAGLWDVWSFDKVGGASLATFDLSWGPSPFPGSDYDLRLYRPGALDDGTLTDDELLARSDTRSFATRHERIELVLPEGKYVVAVVPWQTQGERFDLVADPGWLNKAGTAPGVQLQR